jgi:hypothetical protein
MDMPETEPTVSSSVALSIQIGDFFDFFLQILVSDCEREYQCNDSA